METRYGTNDKGQALVDAIPENHAGYRAITKADWEDLIEGINNPPKTFDQELDSLNLKYEADLDPLVKEHSMARARNTDNENSKVLSAQAKIATLDAWYETERDLLMLKYFS